MNLQRAIAANPRRGISLLEVLISIFVVAVGLLSLMSLLPAAKSVLVEAGQADRSAACGAAGLRMAESYGLQNPATWAVPWSAPSPMPWSGWPASDVRSVCIDPVMVGRNPTAPGIDVGSFPFASSYGPPPSTVWGASATVAVQRLSILPAFTPAARLTLCDRLFTWQDDRTFTLPEDETLRAQSFFTVGPDGEAGEAGTDDDGNGVTDRDAAGQIDEAELGWPGTDDVRPGGIDFTWMITVTPDFAVRRNDQDFPPLPALPVNDSFELVPTGEAVVSVVVFHKRVPVANPTDRVPSERPARAELLDPLGKFVRLRPPGPPATPTAVTEEYWRNLRVGQWVLLAVERPPMALPVSPTTPPPHPIQPPFLFRWYRIAGLGPIDTDTSIAGVPEVGRDAVLAGPDWHDAGLFFVDADTATSLFTAHVIIADNIVGVFEKTIPVEPPSTWSW